MSLSLRNFTGENSTFFSRPAFRNNYKTKKQQKTVENARKTFDLIFEKLYNIIGFM